MYDKIFSQNIDRLNISCDIINTLKENKIITIKELCSKDKSCLKQIGIEKNEIEEIENQLHLEGLNLKY